MSVQPDLFAEGKRRRDRGMAQVLEHEEPTWLETALGWLAGYSARHAEQNDEFTAQDFRWWCIHWDLPQPSNPNAWGAFWTAALRRGIIEHTGRTVKAHMPQSHARRLPVYRGVR